MLSRIPCLKLVLCGLLLSVVWDGVAAGKKKKVIIKVPTHVKHVYHHHLKTIHIQRPQPKPQHHVHHDHFEDVHNDRDDYRGKRHGRGFGSWRGLESEVERPRGYRSYPELTKERPPPAPKGEDFGDQGLRATEGWRPSGGKSSVGKGGWRNNKGVVYEQNYKGKWQPDDYDGPDLTYPKGSSDYGSSKGYGDDYDSNKGYSNDYGSSNGGKSYDYESSNGGKSYNYPPNNGGKSYDYGSGNGGKNYDYGSNNGGKIYGNDYVSNNGAKGYGNDYSYNDYRVYKSDGFRKSPPKDETPHRFNPKPYRDGAFNSKEVSTPEVLNYHAADSDKREIVVLPTRGVVKQTNWAENSNLKTNWRSSTPSSVSSVWPELKEHSSWTQNPSTTLPPFNNLPDLSHANPGTASSYVYHNFGSADAVVSQNQGAGLISPTGASQATIRPLSSYQVQVNHYTERPVRT